MTSLLKLVVNVEFDGPVGSFVTKLDSRVAVDTSSQHLRLPDQVKTDSSGNVTCKFGPHLLRVECPDEDSIIGDVLLIHPKRHSAQRLIRRNSVHNTILFTERCDQMCAMCSQPPNEKDYSPLFKFYEQAILLSDTRTRIGISGGEPTLYMPMLLQILRGAKAKRPDLSFHILTNGQHFTDDILPDLKNVLDKSDVLWGVPLYSQSPAIHDEIVGKIGAFEILMNNLYALGSVGGKIELRTVLTAKNALDLPHLARFISKNLPFISVWAIMAMEPIGFAKANRKQLFFDHSVFPEPVTSAIDVANGNGVQVSLYNFPLCTIPETHRTYCHTSISDWKNKFIKTCNPCTRKNNCSGFFEWYTDRWQWTNVSAI